jgi:hypothetical protein
MNVSRMRRRVAGKSHVATLVVRSAPIVAAALLAVPNLAAADTATENFDAAPALWLGMGNGTIGGSAFGGQYGFSNTNNTLGNPAGEAGGIFFRGPDRSYYADTSLGFVTEAQPFSASGEIFVSAPGADNDVLIGHFRTPPEIAGTNEFHHAGFILRELSSTEFRFMARIRGDGGNQDDGNVVIVNNGAYDFNYTFSGNTLTAKLLQQGTTNVVAESTVSMNQSTFFRGNAFGMSGGFSGTGTAQMTTFIDAVSYTKYIPGARARQTFDTAPADWVTLGNATFGFSNSNNTGPLSPEGEAGGVFAREDVRRAYADTTIGQLTQDSAFGAAGEFFFGSPNNPDTEMFVAHFAQDQVDGIKRGDRTEPEEGGHNIVGMYIIDSGSDNLRMRARLYTSEAVRLESVDTITVPIGDGKFEFDYVWDPDALTLTARIFDDDEAGNQLLATSAVTIDGAHEFTLDAFGLTNGFNGSAVPEFNYTVFIDDVVYTVGGVTGSQWNVDAGGNWTDAGNWQGGVPNAAGAVANFGGIITAPRTVTLDAAQTVGAINFDNTNSYTISGANTLTISGAGASLNVLSGSHTIAAPIVLASDTTVDVATGQTLSVQHLRGAGLSVNSGTLRVIAGGSANSAGGTSKVTSLSIASGAVMDLTNNSAIVDYSGDVGSLVDDVRQHLANGRLTSSSATPGSTRLGYGDNAVVGATTFGGQAVDSSSVLIKFTYAGDADLNGQVDVADLGKLASNWQTSGPWTSGDFDYSGFVDVADLGLLASNWQNGVGSPLGPSLAEALAAVGLPSSAVPEPASAAAVVTLAGLFAGRRRRI